MALAFTTIQHGYRKTHGLSLNEYVICDMIYCLSTSPDSAAPGWCYMSKQAMAEEMGLTKRSIIRILEGLESGGFIEKNSETKYLRSTPKWREVYVCTDGEKKSPMVKKSHSIGEKKSPDIGDKKSPNNIYIDNNKIKNESEDSISVSLLDKAEKIFSEAGLKGQFFSKMKSAHGLTDLELKNHFLSWRIKHQNLTTEFRTDQHLKNSFNRFLAESKNSGGKQTLVKVSGGRLIGG